jgi:membrane protein DedA with SNARE-associated domain
LCSDNNTCYAWNAQLASSASNAWNDKLSFWILLILVVVAVIIYIIYRIVRWKQAEAKKKKDGK